MILLDAIQTLKKATSGEAESFASLIEQAKTKEFPNKENILKHFENIHIKENGSLVHLKYNNQAMFKTPWDKFYMTTRALVIDWVKEEVVLYPFDKFFELDEHTSATQKKLHEKLEKANYVEVTEKIDGSLIVARYYKGQYFVVSSGSFEGLHVDIAERILAKDSYLQDMMKAYPNHTFMLEMKNAEIPQLIQYGVDQLTIIGMRDMNDFRLLTRNEINELARPHRATVAPLFDLSVEEMLAIMENPNTSNNEGYILRIDDFLVKMKTKNFILANRFAGDPARNFNMVIQCIQEGRIEAVRPMIRREFMEAFEKLVNLIQNYVEEKRKTLQELYTQIPEEFEMEEFAKEAQRKFPLRVKDLIAMKQNRYQNLSKHDIKKLKPLAQYFACVSHFKYAEFNDCTVEEVEKQIEDGTISYLKKYEDAYNQKTVYIIHKWQWLTDEKIESVTKG